MIASRLLPSATIVWLPCLLAAIVGGGLAGCAPGDRPPLGNVSGAVTLDGQPLADAEVCFAPAQGRPSLARTDSSGRYALNYVGTTKGAMVGSHRVYISWPLPDSDEEPVKPTAARPPIPERYNRKSTLTAEVRGGSNTFDFKLESK